MKIIFNRIEYHDCEIEIDEKELNEKFNGRYDLAIDYYDNEHPDIIEKLDLVDVKYEIIDV